MILEKRIPLRHLLQMAKKDILFVVPLSVVLTTITEVYGVTFSIPFSIPAFLGTAISLVLSFKLSQSYERWWEARKIWGAIVNDSRNLLVQLRNFCLVKDHKLISLIGNRQIAWCYALVGHLRKTNTSDTYKDYVDNEDWDLLQKRKHVPLQIVDLNAADIATLRSEQAINAYQQVQLDTTLTKLVDSMGQAERIKNTVFPKQYRLFLRMFIYVFIVTLALALGELVYYYEIPLLILITMPFLLLEKTALLLQDPFENRPNDTSMLAISDTIAGNIKELLQEPVKTAPKEEKKSFYVM